MRQQPLKLGPFAKVAHSQIYFLSTLKWGNVEGEHSRQGGYSPASFPFYDRNDLIVDLLVQKAKSRGLIFDAHGVRQNVLILFLKHYYSITSYYH